MKSFVSLKQAFTLAEVLITLAIIGIVAALTIPSVIVKYQKQQTVIKLKKVYSELSNAINQSSIVNGTPDKWDYELSGKDFFNKYFKPYLAVSKECPKNKTAKQCLGVDYYKIDGKTSINHYSWFKGHSVVLKNGVILYIRNYDNRYEGYRPIFFDINGVKKPNRNGIDLFGLLVGYGYKNFYNSMEKTREEYLQECSESQNGCLSLIIKDNWQIKDDYPWK